MDNNLLIFRNELKIKNVPKYKIIGIVSELIFSKTVFPKNIEISKFLVNVFSVQYKDYVLKSRTTIVAKISRYIMFSDNTSSLQKNLYNFICKLINEVSNSDMDKKNTFDGWID